jgi:hypothetical protein
MKIYENDAQAHIEQFFLQIPVPKSYAVYTIFRQA